MKRWRLREEDLWRVDMKSDYVSVWRAGRQGDVLRSWTSVHNPPGTLDRREMMIFRVS